jgi:hypothetical protein
LVAFYATFALFTPSTPANAQGDEAKSGKPAVEYTEDGKMKQPEGYREWIYVGTPLTPHDMNDGEANFPEFHSVYMDRPSWDHYKKTGEFRDGTALVKELSSVGSKEASSGKGYFMGEIIGLEVSVKDSKRFKDEPGYWAYFSFGHKKPWETEAKAQKSFACNACHENNAAEDFVFTQYYPVLREAKKAVGK